MNNHESNLEYAQKSFSYNNNLINANITQVADAISSILRNCTLWKIRNRRYRFRYIVSELVIVSDSYELWTVDSKSICYLIKTATTSALPSHKKAFRTTDKKLKAYK